MKYQDTTTKKQKKPSMMAKHWVGRNSGPIFCCLWTQILPRIVTQIWHLQRCFPIDDIFFVHCEDISIATKFWTATKF